MFVDCEQCGLKNIENFLICKTLLTNVIKKDKLNIRKTNVVLWCLIQFSTVVFATERFTKPDKSVNVTMFSITKHNKKTILFVFNHVCSLKFKL